MPSERARPPRFSQLGSSNQEKRAWPVLGFSISEYPDDYFLQGGAVA